MSDPFDALMKAEKVLEGNEFAALVDLLASRDSRIANLTSENTRLREELELCRASHIRLEHLYNQALGKPGLPPFEQILASKTPPPSHKGED